MSNTQPEVKKLIQIKQIHRPIIEEPAGYEDQIQNELAKLQSIQENIESLKQQQASLITDTENQIIQAKETWEQEKINLIEETKKQGYQAGFEHGEIESKQQFQHLIVQANSIIQAAKKDYELTLEKSEETILLLAVHVAEKILKHELEQNSESFLPIVKDAISAIKDQREISIYLHPDHYEYVLAQKNELDRILDSKATLSIYLNERLEYGSCVIEHPFGKIDASIDTQLLNIQQVLYEIVMEQKE
ncbi:flagellar assembly protein FliH [Ornithinibacillus californiensis]|uniref:flagellar assembly protein FliH n=1 Tax=Ornithinibacillus californiensis TaxID=161536 RepID=UPI00069F9AE8|nr:flagellar assembly protein FliH [Ornithinibacillus californiensis]